MSKQNVKQTSRSLRAYMKSLFQHGPRFAIVKSFTSFSVCHREFLNEKMTQLLKNPDVYMQENIIKIDLIKPTTIVSLVRINNQDMVLKRYNIKSFTHGLKRAFQTTRAKKCWKSAHRLLWHGINTPKPIAMVEKRIGPIHRQAYFIYEYIPGPEGFEVFLEKPGTAEETQLKAENTVTLFHKMFANNISHGDMKASNIIFEDNKPYIIDLDAMKFHRNQARANKKKAKDVKRFMENWENQEVKDLFETLL